jgi:hypothetical protein
MSGYTKGPWFVDKTLKAAINAGSKHIAMVNYYASKEQETNVSGEEHDANVQLIVTAPELLEALEALVKYNETGEWPNLDPVCTAKRAISKARGGVV